jgi:lipopolysaccharide transport system permease protein
VFAVLGHYPGSHALWLPILMGLTLLLGMGVGIILGALNVFMRDIGQVVPVILQALFWLTPIVYSIDVLPERYHDWFQLNPLYPLVTSYQKVLVFGEPPLWGSLAWLVLAAAVTWMVALLVFRRSSAEMVDAL